MALKLVPKKPPAKKKRGVSKQAAFLAAYGKTASITKAAKAATIEARQHYRWLADDPAYPKDFDQARELAGQTLEDEAVRRAHEGIDEPLVYQGQFSYKQRIAKDKDGNVLMEFGRPKIENYGAPLAIRKYSDGLTMFLLRGFKPEKYQTRGSVELSGPGGGPIQVTDKRLEGLTDEELAGLIAVAKKIENS